MLCRNATLLLHEFQIMYRVLDLNLHLDLPEFHCAWKLKFAARAILLERPSSGQEERT